MNFAEPSIQLQAILSRLEKVKHLGKDEYQACCPAHSDKSPSLCLRQAGNRILMHCQAGCALEHILRIMGLQMSDLFINNETQLRSLVATYDYQDENGNLLFQVLRYQPKSFRQRRPDGKSSFLWNLEGVRRVLYRLPDVLRAVTYGDPIYLVEGEKDANSIWEKAVLPATCNSQGAGKWQEDYTQSLTGAREVVIIPDNDEPGYAHARKIAESLYHKVNRLKILLIPPPFKDFSDWMESFPKWNNHGRLDYDYELIPQEFARLSETAEEYQPDYCFPDQRFILRTAGGVPL